MFNKFFKYKYILYLKYIRYRIYYIRDVYNIINIIKNISYVYIDLTSDKLSQILTDCFNLYPLSDTELQTLSIIQQTYDTSLGIENYASFIIWISCIQSITERYNTLLLK